MTIFFITTPAVLLGGFRAPRFATASKAAVAFLKRQICEALSVFCKNLPPATIFAASHRRKIGGARFTGGLSFVLFCFLFLCFAAPINAANTDLATAQKLLAGIAPQSGKFEQRSGNIRTHGTYRMDFPQRFRFVLDNGAIITIGRIWIALQDKSGEEANRFPISATPLALLRRIAAQDFAPATIAPYVVKLEATATHYWLTLKDKSGKISGEMVLVFSANKVLRGWRSIDAQNNLVEVQLYDVAIAPQPRRLFSIDENE